MGYIPIFISLGGFVFLFAMLVNYNLNSKRKLYFIRLEDLKKMISEAYPTLPVGDNMNLQELELQYREKKKDISFSNNASVDSKINSQIAACKMARFQYQQLKETKPYFFVAKVFGHRVI